MVEPTEAARAVSPEDPTSYISGTRSTSNRPEFATRATRPPPSSSTARNGDGIPASLQHEAARVKKSSTCCAVSMFCENRHTPPTGTSSSASTSRADASRQLASPASCSGRTMKSWPTRCSRVISARTSLGDRETRDPGPPDDPGASRETPAEEPLSRPAESHPQSPPETATAGSTAQARAARLETGSRPKSPKSSIPLRLRTGSATPGSWNPIKTASTSLRASRP